MLWLAAALAAGAEESRVRPLGRADGVAAAWWSRRDVDQRRPSRWAAPDSYCFDQPAIAWGLAAASGEEGLRHCCDPRAKFQASAQN
ncbi:hypothetical protein L484_011842 [Morus notabilis]|uniref:Uncharacterized protein n=1 Tax=Morus notabilis TaxID=981085 RepID=W9S1S6_9ROSA|nr:hypothetical protein L484_011842 [Morus notabilis]